MILRFELFIALIGVLLYVAGLSLINFDPEIGKINLIGGLKHRNIFTFIDRLSFSLEMLQLQQNYFIFYQKRNLILHEKI